MTATEEEGGLLPEGLKKKGSVESECGYQGKDRGMGKQVHADPSSQQKKKRK